VSLTTHKGSPDGSGARRGDLIAIAIDTAPLASDVATMIFIEVWPLKLLITAQILAFFLQFFMGPPDAAMALEETELSIYPGIRALNNKIGDGLKGLVIDVLKQRSLRLHLCVHRLELGWVEDRMHTPGEITPAPGSRSRAKDAAHQQHAERTPDAKLSAAGATNRSGRSTRSSANGGGSSGCDRAAGGCGGSAGEASCRWTAHMMILRVDELIFDWEDPPEVAAEPLSEPREQGFYTTATSCQAVFLPPSIPPSAWLLRDDVVDCVVAATGWHLQPVANLMLRFVVFLDKLPPTTFPLGLKWRRLRAHPLRGTKLKDR
jgi:hypothetical protein